MSSHNTWTQEEALPGNLAGSAILHVLVVGALFGWAFIFHHHGKAWGESSNTAGAIQATMVNSLPLPPRAQPNPENVLTAETPSPAPPIAKEKAAPIPEPKAIPIPTKPEKPVKVAATPTPATPHPQPLKPQPDKATTGETAGIRIAMTSAETKVGTVSVGTPDAAFGARYAYYVRQLTAKVSSQWLTQMLDARAPGHRVHITFQVERDGTPTHLQIQQPSGDATLDATALRAMQHVDTFGPLPEGYAGSHINVVYYFDPPAHP